MSVVNNGTIDVNGVRGTALGDGTPLANQGIYVSGTTHSTSNIENAGVINLNGVNGIGIQAVSGGKATNSGTINVSAAAGGNAQLPNYGLWAEGADSSVVLTGSVNLASDNAIGVHARNGGNISISGNGRVNFQGGQKQIGYYVYGPTSTISNVGTGAQDVSTEGSTLFRIAAGAGFVGGAGAASQLTASGQNATALVVTGKDEASGQASRFKSGGMTIDVTGEGATGVRVEGGADGEIASTATINLNQANATAAIVDGQAYDTSGAASGTVDTNTSLKAGAALNSSLDGVTGYIARNGASLTNSGAIAFTGADTTGISVDEGSTGTNTGNISVADGSVGLVARSSGADTTLNNSGTVVLTGGSDAHRTTGVLADGSKVTVNFTDGSIDMRGQGAIGVQAINGATVNLSGAAVPTFAGSGFTNQIAFRLAGAGSTINTNLGVGTVLDASGTDSTLFRLDDGASLTGVLQLQASGTRGQGIAASGAGTVVDVAAGSNLTVAGQDARALSVSGGAHATLQAGTTANLTGNGAVVGIVDGNEYDLAGNVTAQNTDATLVNYADLTSPQAGTTAFITQNQGKLINFGTIDLSATTGNSGVQVLGGRFENHGNISVNGSALYVEGADSVVVNHAGKIEATDGEAAVKLGAGASLNLVGSGLGEVTAGGSAHGVLVGTGAAGLVADGVNIHVTGSGNGIENQAEIAGMQLNGVNLTVAEGAGIRTGNTMSRTNSGLITVDGDGAGIAFMNADGSMTTHDLDMSDSAGLLIKVTAASGHGIVTNTNGDVKTGASVNIADAAGGEALVIGGTTANVVQSGNLNSISTVAAVVSTGSATNFTNTGKIAAVTSAHDAFSFGTNAIELTNAAGAEITGKTAFNHANNTLVNSGLIDGDVTAGNGDNSVTVAGSGKVTGAVTLGNGDNSVLLQDAAEVTTVKTGSGSDSFTLQGSGQTFSSLDGGVGAGFDSLTFDGHDQTLTNSLIFRNFEAVNLENNSTFTLNTALKLGDNGSDAGTLNIDGTSTLAVETANIFALNNTLAGTGTVIVDTAGHAFDFTSNTGSAFAGMVKLGDSAFNLSGANTAALTNATLSLESGSTTTVGAGAQQIGGLAFNGGTAVFDVTVPVDREAAGTIVTAGNLDLSGTGTVKVNVPSSSSFSNDQPLPNTAASLLEQDDQNALLKLASSDGTVTGGAGNLALVDQTANVISGAQQLDISQGGLTVARGTYDYRLTSGQQGDGLYVNYGLKEVELMGTGGDALILAAAAGATGTATDLSAKLTGTGDVAIDTGKGSTVSLSNSGNDYTGATDVRSGTLQLANDNALGGTSNLSIEAGAAVDVNGKSQTIGALDGQVGSTLDINGGSLTLAQGGTSAGSLTGSGQLNVAAGELDVQGANSTLTAKTSISVDATVKLDDAAGLGNGTIANEGTLSLDGAGGMLANAVSGTGAVNLLNGSTVTAAGDSRGFSGTFNVASDSTLTVAEANNLGTAEVVNEGKLVVNDATDWTMANTVSGIGTLVKEGTGALTVTGANIYTGGTQQNEGTLVLGNANALGTGTLAMAGGTKLDFLDSYAIDNAITLSGDATINVDGELTTTLAGVITDGTAPGTLEKAGTGTLVLGNASNTYSGATNVLEGTLQAGATNAFSANSEVSVASGATLDLAGMNQTIAGLTNGGTVAMGANSAPGTVLTVKGDMVGSGGAIVMNTTLGDDTSATDRIVLDGGHASGSTELVLKHDDSDGAQTTRGINLVQTQNGATTDVNAFSLSSLSDGYREGIGSIVAGAYDYSLKRGGNGGTADDWYLVSGIGVRDEDLPGRDEEPPVRDEEPSVRDEEPPVREPSLRPEVGSYLDNRQTAMTMQFHTLHDREAQPLGASDAANGQPGPLTDAKSWARVQGTVGERGIANGLNSTGTSYLLHAGTDVARFDVGGTGSLNLGVMGQYGNSSGSTSNGQLSSKQSVQGFSAGVYGTWRGNRNLPTGPYVDTWLMYGAFRNSVTGQGLASESYRSRNLAASVEGGYAFQIFDSANVKQYIEPQVQVIYSNYTAKDHTEANGTVVSGMGANSVTTRVGVRLHGEVFDDAGVAKASPFAELNWWHGPSSRSMQFDKTLVNDTLPANRGELKVGLQGNVTKSLSLWGSAGVLTDMGAYTEGRFQAGLKYRW